jgi:hypothetical protein
MRIGKAAKLPLEKGSNQGPVDGLSDHATDLRKTQFDSSRRDVAVVPSLVETKLVE